MAQTVTDLEPGLRRVLAPNPSPMTFRGTNTYIVGTGTVAIIDPGPDDRSHLQAILTALGPGETVSHILVTHSHMDHSPLARPLADATGAPVLAFGTHLDGRSAVMDRLVRDGLTGGGEGIDHAFAPDHRIDEGDRITGDDWQVDVIRTPGHTANHLSFAWNGALFTGDHVMGWASSLVSPPDGDLTAFMASCRKLQARTDRIYYPGHGAPVTIPAERINWLVAHRLSREAQILAQLDASPDTVSGLTGQIYTDTPPALLPAAERNVLAHVIDLHARTLVGFTPPLTRTTLITRLAKP